MLFAPSLRAYAALTGNHRLPLLEKILTTQPVKKPQLSQDIMHDIINICCTVEVLPHALLEAGNLQEVIWQLQERGLSDRAQALEELLTETLEDGEVVSMHDIGIGVTGARLVEFSNGLRGVFKNMYFRSEVAMFELDKLIGLHVFPLTVLRTLHDEQGSMQLYIESSMSATEIQEQLWQEMASAEDKRQLLLAISPSAKIRTLRLLGLDKDINPANRLFPLQGRQIAIDGGYSFYTPGFGQEIAFRDFRADPVSYYTDPDFIEQLKKLTTKQMKWVVEPIRNAWADNSKKIKNIHDMMEASPAVLTPPYPNNMLLSQLERVYEEEYLHLGARYMEEKRQELLFFMEYKGVQAALAERVLSFIDFVEQPSAYMPQKAALLTSKDIEEIARSRTKREQFIDAHKKPAF